MVSGALGKISRLCPHMFFVMQILVIFALPLPSCAPSLGAWAGAPVAYP